jgi:hypothetical protein
VARVLQRRLGNQGTQALVDHLGTSHCVQAKLAVSQPGDPYEREADRVADAVMRMPEPASSIGSSVAGVGRETIVQRLCTECEEEGKASDVQRKETSAGAASSVSANAGALTGSGSPLSPATRSFFEPRFGVDFSHVRLHTDADAAEAARSIDAKAFTVGSHIAFGSGQFVPEAPEGRRLLAHELTHVLQQSDGSMLQRQPLDLARVGKILSLKEIRADPKREKARKAANQTTAKACKSPSGGFGKGNCPATLEPGMRVTIVGEKAGGTWLEIKASKQPAGFKPNESCYVMAAFVKEDPAAAVPKDVGPPIKDITRRDQMVKISGLPNKQPNYIDYAIRRLESAPVGADITLIPKAGTGNQNGISIPKGDFYIDSDPLSGFSLGQMAVYQSRSVAEAVVTDLMKQAPDTPAYAYYIQDGIILPTTLSATTIPNLLPHIRDKRDQDLKDLQATADLAKAVAWWYAGARFPIRVRSGAPTAKETAKQLEKEAAKRAEREAAKQAEKEAAKQAEKEAAKKAEREAVKQAGKRTPAVQPSAPPGWKGTLNDFGQKVGWPVGGQARVAAEAADLVKLRNMGVTQQWASAQAQIYREVARLNPQNPTAVLRAEWLEKIAARLGGAL